MADLLPAGSRPSAIIRYSVAVGLAGVGIALRVSLSPVLGDRAPLFSMPFVVFFAAYFGGVGPGLLATILSGVASAYFFMRPAASFRIERLADELMLISFFGIGTLISLLSERAQRLWRKAMSAELALAESRYLNLVHQSEEPMVVLTDGRISIINRSAVALLGWRSSAELAQKPFVELVGEADRELTREWLATLKPGSARPPAPVGLVDSAGQVVEAYIKAELLLGKRPRTQVTLSERRRGRGPESARGDRVERVGVGLAPAPMPESAAV